MSKSIIFILILLLQLYSTPFIKVCNDLFEQLHLDNHSTLNITVLEDDKNYLLPLTPIYEEIKKGLSTKVKEVHFHSVQGKAMAPIYELLTMTNGNANIPVPDITVDSLIFSGTYDILSTDSVYCKLEILDINGTEKFSETFIVKKGDSPQMDMEFFHQLEDPEMYENISYRKRVIKAVDELYYNSQFSFFSLPAIYRFEKINPYANDKQVETVRWILGRKYGITIDNSSQNTISVINGGSLVFVKNGKEFTIPHIVDGESMFPDIMNESLDSYEYEVNGNYYSKSIETPIEKNIRNQIITTFEDIYPTYFAPFNRQKLEQIYSPSGKTILWGAVEASDPRTGVEKVRYVWLTRDQWIAALENKTNQGRRFDVTTKVLKIYQSSVSNTRYWAIIRQDWQTFNRSNRLVYHDDGFLIVNFDFDPTSGNLQNFEIGYRIWINDYKYDQISPRLTRVEKLSYDLQRYFIDEVHGIDTHLKYEIVDYIIDLAKEQDRALKLPKKQG